MHWIHRKKWYICVLQTRGFELTILLSHDVAGVVEQAQSAVVEQMALDFA